jgi:hypothetical protein
MDSRLADTTGVLVETPKDERILEYLVAEKGEEAVRSAVGQLAGHRRPYVSNIVKIMAIEIPDDVVITPRDEGLVHLESIKQLLRKK